MFHPPQPLFLDSSYPVYGVKSVVSIPLDEHRARTVVNSIAIRYHDPEHAAPTPGHEPVPDIYGSLDSAGLFFLAYCVLTCAHGLGSVSRG